MPQIMILGEAWGADEKRTGLPFQGAAGYHLNLMLQEAGIVRSECYLTNVFNLQPKGNNLADLCGDKTGGIPSRAPLVPGKYARREFGRELDRLADEMLREDPNIVIALGNTALWALANSAGITKVRGTTFLSTHTASGFKCLATFHPSFIMRGQWAARPTVIADLAKARFESAWPEIIRPPRSIIIEPTLEDIHDYFAPLVGRITPIAVDIETSGTQITELGIASSRESAIVIPFVHPGRAGRSYWPDAGTELEVWRAIRGVLESPRPEKIFQNGLYDIAVLWRSYGIGVRGAAHDTMLLHHSLQPESLKGLGYLGSIYCDERAWKVMRSFGVKTLKGEDE
jgi:uracil-DNA glycosylase